MAAVTCSYKQAPGRELLVANDKCDVGASLKTMRCLAENLYGYRGWIEADDPLVLADALNEYNHSRLARDITKIATALRKYETVFDFCAVAPSKRPFTPAKWWSIRHRIPKRIEKALKEIEKELASRGR